MARRILRAKAVNRYNLETYNKYYNILNTKYLVLGRTGGAKVLNLI